MSGIITVGLGISTRWDDRFGAAAGDGVSAGAPVISAFRGDGRDRLAI